MKRRNKYHLERVDLGFWTLPKPPDPLKKYRKEWERIPNLQMYRQQPFGYILDPADNDWLLPVDNELSLLDLAKKHVRKYSYNDVAAWLSTQTGRYISGKGLKKRIEIDRRRKRLIDLKRFYARRYKKILEQLDTLEKTRLGKAKDNAEETRAEQG